MYGPWLFFQKCAEWLLFSMLVSMEPPLQILNFDIFIFIFYFINTAPTCGVTTTDMKNTVVLHPYECQLLWKVLEHFLYI
jgi:hypothetical protein